MIKFICLLYIFGIFLFATGCSQHPDLSRFNLEEGKAVYNNVCIACHLAGMPSAAPKLGDRAAWTPRIAQGMDGLFNHALNGLNDMPAKGGHPQLSDMEVKNAVAYLVSHSW